MKISIIAARGEMFSIFKLIQMSLEIGALTLVVIFQLLLILAFVVNVLTTIVLSSV